MDIETLLQDTDARVNLRNRWLTGDRGEWAVYGLNRHARLVKILYSGNSLDEAIKILLRQDEEE